MLARRCFKHPSSSTVTVKHPHAVAHSRLRQQSPLAVLALDVDEGLLVNLEVHCLLHNQNGHWLPSTSHLGCPGRLQPFCQFRLAPALHCHPPHRSEQTSKVQTRGAQLVVPGSLNTRCLWQIGASMGLKELRVTAKPVRRFGIWSCTCSKRLCMQLGVLLVLQHLLLACHSSSLVVREVARGIWSHCIYTTLSHSM